MDRLVFSDAQLEGRACVGCGGPMVEPICIGRGPRGQLFAHRNCWPDNAAVASIEALGGYVNAF